MARLICGAGAGACALWPLRRLCARTALKRGLWILATTRVATLGTHWVHTGFPHTPTQGNTPAPAATPHTRHTQLKRRARAKSPKTRKIKVRFKFGEAETRHRLARGRSIEHRARDSDTRHETNTHSYSNTELISHRASLHLTTLHTAV